MEYKDAYDEDRYKVGQPDCYISEDGYIMDNTIPAKYFSDDYEFDARWIPGSPAER